MRKHETTPWSPGLHDVTMVKDYPIFALKINCTQYFVLDVLKHFDICVESNSEANSETTDEHFSFSFPGIYMDWIHDFDLTFSFNQHFFFFVEQVHLTDRWVLSQGVS